jgi:hypothetical protein
MRPYIFQYIPHACKPIVPFFHFYNYSVQKPIIACYYFLSPGCILSLYLYTSGSTFISV